MGCNAFQNLRGLSWQGWRFFTYHQFFFSLRRRLRLLGDFLFCNRDGIRDDFRCKIISVYQVARAKYKKQNREILQKIGFLGNPAFLEHRFNCILFQFRGVLQGGVHGIIPELEMPQVGTDETPHEDRGNPFLGSSLFDRFQDFFVDPQVSRNF